MDTTAIIQFIGIVLFSSAVPADPGVHAIVPRIDQATHHHQQKEQKDQLNIGDVKSMASGYEELEGVENHVAVLLFRKRDVIGTAGTWKRTGELRSDWQFVQLDGEQVQFLTNGVNDAPAVPASLPRIEGGDCLVQAEATTGFKDAFQAPDYAGAAAVIDIPLGTLAVCGKKSAHSDSVIRVDTTLAMKNEGVLVIAARRASDGTAKTITLHGGALVYVANVPPRYVFEGTYDPMTSDSHWEAYHEMIDTPCPSRPQMPPVAEACDLSGLSEAWRIAQNDPPTLVLMMVGSECSNTQWP